MFNNMRKQRLNLEPGVKYRGYGFVNEFGEFEFTPEQKGINKGKRKLLKNGDCFNIAETKQCVIVHITLPRVKERLALIKEFLQVTNEVINIINEYEI